MTYDSTKDTWKHIENVQNILKICINELEKRKLNHDQSKLKDPEKEFFDVYTPKLKKSTYGSDEYKLFLKELKPALDHHYANNRHHPEHFVNGIQGMDLIDVLEMCVDWYCASKRHEDGDPFKSIDINQKRFNFSDDLVEIFRNTMTFLIENEE